LCLHREMAIYDLIEDRRHILKTYGLHSVPWGGIDLVILSMEYADGGTLRDLLLTSNGDGAITREQRIEYFRHICHGIDALHAVGIVMGDLKPENIAIVNGVCKVFDLSHASVAQGIAIRASSFLRDAVRNLTIGTLEYVSPEQFVKNANNLDRRSDIYSLGLILREMVGPNGSPLFENPYQRMRQLYKQDAIPSLAGVAPTVSHVITRCLATDPSHRYHTVQDVLDDLQVDSETRPGETTGEADNHVEGMWQTACRHVTELRLDQARGLCRQIIAVRPDHEHAAALLNDVEHRDRRATLLYEAIDKGMGRRSVDQLCALLEEAVGTYPNHPRGEPIQGMLQERAKAYRIAMEQGKEAICRGDWLAAQESFEKARQLNPGTNAAEKAMRFVAAVFQQIRHGRQQIDWAARARNWDRAMAVARRIDEFVDSVIQTVSQPEGVDSRDV